MDILELNRNAWNSIGKDCASPYIKNKKYLEMFNDFCKMLPEGSKILDLGCGPAIPIAKEFVRKGFKVLGIDISDKMIELAKKNVPEGEYRRMSMTDIDFDNEFDAVFSGYSMLCLDPEKFKRTAEKIVKSLKKNGLFFLALNDRPPNHKKEENYASIMGQKLYSRPYTEEEVREIFSELGLTILKIERETTISEVYGKEYSLLFLMKKEYLV